jgi:ABC-type Mn2+/Zn2+ transport system ATPase subunit
MNEQLFRLEHVTCSYSGTPAIQAVDLSVEAGEFVGVVGPSGCGKTTVLRAVLGTVAPAHGGVRRRDGLRVAYVPQVETVDWNFPVTVGEVVGMSLPRATRAGRAAQRREVDDVLGRRHIRDLSAGQQQRVFLARALVQRPDLLLLDEPTNGVDVRTRHEVLHVLADLNDDGITVVLTTHDINGLAAHLPRLVCLNRTVIADGLPAEVLHPYVLERTYGAPMEVLHHGGMPVVLEHDVGELRARLSGRSA